MSLKEGILRLMQSKMMLLDIIAFFVLWNKLPRMFQGYRALMNIYQDFC